MKANNGGKKMQYDAIILAGGESSSDLKKIAPYDNEALIIIGNYPMIYYVYKALRSSGQINKIVVSGPVESIKAILPRDERLIFVNGGENAIESFAHAVKAMDNKGISSKVLIMPTDIPFITKEAIEDFLKRCETSDDDFYYPVTRKEVNEKKFPGVQRTYVRLREGTVTGGNLFLIRSAVIDKSLEMGLKLVERRKNPLAMARLFGFSLAVKYVFGKLSIDMAEERFYKILGIKGKGIISPYAEIGVDVDKPSDLELAQDKLGSICFAK
ncbi:MAG TPA: nucleotidyltransferase family protein [Syntrophomonas sp.]|nr:nucleotidyltransferase family protein [Syntrophomonas sp.]